MTDWTVEKLRKIPGSMLFHLNHGSGKHSYGYTFPDCPRLGYGYSTKRGRRVSETFTVDGSEVPDLEAACELLNAEVTESAES